MRYWCRIGAAGVARQVLNQCIRTRHLSYLEMMFLYLASVESVESSSFIRSWTVSLNAALQCRVSSQVRQPGKSMSGPVMGQRLCHGAPLRWVSVKEAGTTLMGLEGVSPQPIQVYGRRAVWSIGRCQGARRQPLSRGIVGEARLAYNGAS